MKRTPLAVGGDWRPEMAIQPESGHLLPLQGGYKILTGHQWVSKVHHRA